MLGARRLLVGAAARVRRAQNSHPSCWLKSAAAAGLEQRPPLRRGLATAKGGGGGGGSSSEGGEDAERRRAALRKKFGVSEEDSKTDTKGKQQPLAEGAEGKGKGKGKDGGEGEDEVDYMEVWGDYIEYMEHQRTQGWKT